MEERSAPVKSVEKAFKLLDCFLEKGKRLSLKELAALTGWPKSTIHNLRSTMRRQGVIVQDEDDGKYGMGIKVFQLGNCVEHTSSVVRVAQPVMEATAESAHRSVHLTALHYPQIVLISKVEPKSNTLQMIVPVGQEMPLYCIAHGKLFLAFSSSNLVQDYVRKTPLKPFTTKTITDPDKLLKQLGKIHTQGYAVEREERNVGISAVAAPILNAQGTMVYSVGVVGIFNDLNPNEFRSTTSMVVRAAHSITEKLKC